MRSEHKPVLPRLSSSLHWGGSGAWLRAHCCCLKRGRGCQGSRAMGELLQAPVWPGASPGRGVATVEMAITPNLLVIKNTLSQLPGRGALTVGEGSPVLSLAKPALQSDEGSKKTASGALRNTFFWQAGAGEGRVGARFLPGEVESTLPWPGRGTWVPKHSGKAGGSLLRRRHGTNTAPCCPRMVLRGARCWGEGGWQGNTTVPMLGHYPPPTSSLGTFSPKPGLRLAEAPTTAVEGKTEVPDSSAPTLRPSQAGAAQR